MYASAFVVINVESKAPHGMVLQEMSAFSSRLRFPRNDSLLIEAGSNAHSTHQDKGLSGRPSISHRVDKVMARSGDDAHWRDLEAHAHLLEVQELIRQEIQKGTIRVRPDPDGSIRIMPVRQPGTQEPRK